VKKRSHPWITWLVLLPFLLFGLGLLCANLYVQSAKMREFARSQVESALQMPVDITQTSVTPWSGFSIKGVTVEHPEQEAPFLAVKRFRVQFGMTDLMRGVFQPRIVHIENPAILWVQSDNGQWELPRLEKPAPLLTQVEVVPQTTPPPDTPPSPSPSPTAPSPSLAPVTQLEPESTTPTPDPTPTTPTFKVHIDEGLARLMQKNGRALLSIDGLNVRSRVANDSLAFGTIAIDQVRCHDGLRLQDITADFMHYPPVIGLEAVNASVAGGQLTARGTLQTLPPSNARLEGSFTEVDLGLLLEDLGMNEAAGGGKFAGSFAMEGPLDYPDQLTGFTKVALNDGYIRDHPFLTPLGNALSINELTNLPIDQIAIEGNLRDGQIFLEKCRLDSNRVALSAGGIVTLDGLIDLQARLALEDGLVDRLPGIVRRSFTRDAETGNGYLAFEITGEVDHPKTDLLDKMVNQAIGSATEGLLEKFRGK